MGDILGLGTDLLELERFRESIKEHGDHLLNRLFTEKEISYCKKFKDSAPHFAGRFAAKEAIVKALGTGFGKAASFHDIEILNEESGKPMVFLSEKLKSALPSPTILISISHSKLFVTATALWIKKHP